MSEYVRSHRMCPWRALTALLAVASGSAWAQEPPGLWRPVAEGGLGAAPAMRRLAPTTYRTLALDRAALRGLLARAPREETSEAVFAPVLMDVPWPDGRFKSFRIEESPIMEPELAARFPEIKTYRGQGVDDTSAILRFDWTPAGFHAIVLSAEGTVYIDPYSSADTANYVVYDRRHYRRADAQPFRCQVTGEDLARPGAEESATVVQQIPHGATLRTYRLAVAATGEYTTFFGGTVPGAMAGITTTMNRVNALYQRDLAVTMVLVANNSSVVYTNGATDPYTHGDAGLMICENARNLDAIIGQSNYDIGHVFDSDGGGLAVGGLCSNGNGCLGPPGSHKGRAMTGSPSPQGDAFDVDYVAHEMGHQLGALHTFNGTTDGCSGGNRTPTSAYEPGSGATIMAYAGLCGVENLQFNSDAYFHARSQEEIISLITLTSCAALSATGNLPPVVDAGANYTVPSQTPFTLTALGTDADGDPLTYAWEEYDLGAAAPPNTDDGTRPIFRSFLPTASPSRTFPKLSDILSNVATFGESLPTTTRTMTFRVTARDNRASGGGTASDDMTLSVRSDSGPFIVTAPNTAVLWPAGSMQTVTWNVANTAAAPVSCANVKVSLSTNGGTTFPIVLAASTPNDGSETLLVPGNVTAMARVKVEAVGNVFFDVSNANFMIAVTDLIFKDGFQ